MGVREFDAFTATDMSSDVVVVPFPTNYPRHGTIIIYDVSKLYRHEYKATTKRVFEFVGNIGLLLREFSLVWPDDTSAVSAEVPQSGIAWFTSKAADVAAAAFGVDTFLDAAGSTAEENPPTATAIHSCRSRRLGVTILQSTAGAIGMLAITTAAFGVAPLSAVFAKIFSYGSTLEDNALAALFTR